MRDRFSASRQLPVVICYIAISYAIWVSMSLDSPIETHWYTLQTYSIDIGIDHPKPHHRRSCRLNMADNWFQPYQIMQKIGISTDCCDDFGSVYFICNMSMRSRDNLSILEFQTYSIDSGIDQRKLHRRTSRCLDTAGNWIRQYQIMLNKRKICRIAAYRTHCT